MDLKAMGLKAMDLSAIPVEIWAEISGHDYDVYRALRGVNKVLCAWLTTHVEVQWRFNYVYNCVSISEDIQRRMVATFRRFVLVLGSRSEVNVYKYGKSVRSYSYRVDGNGEMVRLKWISRGADIGPKHVYEYVSFNNDGRIHYYNRHRSVNGEDDRDETFWPIGGRLTRYDVNRRENIAVPPGVAPFAIRDAWYVYHPVSS